MWVVKTPLVSLSGGIMFAVTLQGDLYGVPGASFELKVQSYPNTTAAVATSFLSATYNHVNGSVPSLQVRAAIGPDGQFSILIGDPTATLPVSTLSIKDVMAWNTGTQCANTAYIGGKWSITTANADTGFTSIQVIKPAVNLPQTYRAISAATTLTTGDYVINVTGGTFTQALPTGMPTGKVYVFRNTGTGTLTVGGTIDGVTNATVAPTTGKLTVMFNGTNWISL
jgi:hypothetical protein